MPNAEVSYLDGTDVKTAAMAAKNADMVFVFATQWRTEAIDIHSLTLPDGQDALIAAVAAANPRTALVLETGGAVLMPWLSEVGAVVEAWYPGERGGEAIARVLFGEIDATGRLPLTFPANDQQMPRAAIPGLDAVTQAAAREEAKKPTVGATTIDLSGGVESFPVDYSEGADVGHRWYARTGAKPLFPFGYGLSFTRFEYGALHVEGGAVPRISFTVTNRGKRAGSDTPQVYADSIGAAGQASSRLIAFQKVTLGPGESKSVLLTFDPRLIARYDVSQPGWFVSAGSVPISIRRNANDVVLAGTLKTAEIRLKP